MEIEKYGKIHHPTKCTWRCNVSETFQCDYEYKDFEDYLVHNYYHAHIQRISAISEEHNTLLKNRAECQTPWTKTKDLYKSYKKEIRCRWNHKERNHQCDYMCMVPEFLQLHVLNEIDVDWGPKLWKKDQKLTCYWDCCEYLVDTRQKGARKGLIRFFK